MSATENLIDNINKVLLTGQKVYGVSDTNLNNTNFGGLQGIMNLVQQTMPVREPIDPALISLIGFSKMGEEASKPGATALGSGFSGISTAAQTYLADQLARQKEKSDATKTGLTLGATLLKPKTKKMPKSLSSQDMLYYLPEDKAKQYLINKGVPEGNVNFKRLLSQITTDDKNLHGTQVTDQNGLSLGLNMVVGADGLFQDANISILKGATQSRAGVYKSDRLKKLAKDSGLHSQLFELLPRMETAMQLILETPTGAMENFTLPIRNFLRSFGVQDENLQGQLMLSALSNALAPMMRPAGSGSTSDMEFRAYQRAILDLGNTPKANYITLYTTKKFKENSLKSQTLEKNLLASPKNYSVEYINDEIFKQDKGIFKKISNSAYKLYDKNNTPLFENEADKTEIEKDFLNNLDVGDVFLNDDGQGNKIFDEINSPYIVKFGETEYR
jgi:hypothetical protein